MARCASFFKGPIRIEFGKYGCAWVSGYVMRRHISVSSEAWRHIQREKHDPILLFQIPGVEYMGSIGLLAKFPDEFAEGSQCVVLTGFHFNRGDIVPVPNLAFCEYLLIFHTPLHQKSRLHFCKRRRSQIIFPASGK